ncbi:MAG TPA: nucleoside-diphosphate sugar epimerase/dehydratase [Flavobacteriales bacterium]|nr:nucleoside-diphosphate sugar epimerase/dehydratase [Flavobacteriales bacterium]
MALNRHNAPVWIIFLGDLFTCFVSIWAAYLLRFNFRIPADEIVTLPLVFTVVLVVRAVSALVFQTHRGIIRFTNTKDVERIFLSVAAASAIFIAINPVMFWIEKHYLIPYSIIIIDGILSVFLMVIARILIKSILYEFSQERKEKTRVVIYGAGDTGLTAKRAIERDAGAKYKVISYIDDNPQKIGKKVQGISIRSSADLKEILDNYDVRLLIIAIENLPANTKQSVIELCLANNTKVFNVPAVKSWINGELSFKQIKKININDLLEREPIHLDTHLIQENLSGKTVLVSGAAGSIGSELVKQILPFKPGKLILLDQAESPLYEIERELLDELFVKQIEVVLGDIRSEERMRRVFDHFKPDVVFHAAAYKHVPLMESNPSEAILTNVLGTRNLADLSAEFGVKKFVMVSTDKAVNPTNVMGASKRIAEMYVQSLGQTCSTRFVTTRFGNVLGSNGSVIPIFKKQIERGGPVTVTHPEITRYFMTIPEACQLVLEAGTIGQGGEIFIFDMGKSVKIVDLVRKMIKLYGLTVGKDIEIVYTGLRPGEKLYEELLNDKENTLPTHHPQIMRAKVQEFDHAIVRAQVDDLILMFSNQNNTEIVSHMKAMVPEYKSNNSEFEQLDIKPKHA